MLIGGRQSKKPIFEQKPDNKNLFINFFLFELHFELYNPTLGRVCGPSGPNCQAVCAREFAI